MKTCQIGLLLSVTLTSILTLAGETYWEDTSTGITWYYTDKGTEVEIIRDGWTAAAVGNVNGTVSVPTTIIGKPVCKIGTRAFAGCGQLVGVTYPPTITSIGDFAFENCASLKSFEFSEKISSVGHCAFSGCSALVQIAVPSTVTLIGDCAFKDCASLTTITFPLQAARQIVNYNGVDTLMFLFTMQLSGSPVSTIIINDAVEEIVHHEFRAAGTLVNIQLPKTVRHINEAAFQGCTALRSISLSDGVVTVGDQAFMDCPNLTTVVLPDSVTDIGKESFSGCTRLEFSHFPASLETIGDAAFSGCLAIKSLAIPEGLALGRRAFSGCRNLKSVSLPSDIAGIPNSLFSGCSSLQSIVVPEGVTHIGEYAFNGCYSLRSIVFPEGVTHVGEMAFCNCSSISKVSMPSTLRVLANGSFYGCEKLLDVDLNEGLLQMGAGAFCECTSLPSITIPSTVTSLGGGLFFSCTGLTKVIMKCPKPGIYYVYGDETAYVSSLYANTPDTLTTYIDTKHTSWNSDIEQGSWMDRAIVRGTGDGGGGTGDSGSTDVSMTITNVVVYYVLNSVNPNIAVPVSMDTGYVNVLTEIKGGAVSIPVSWKDNYPMFDQKFGADFNKAILAKSGKKDSSGKEMFVWQDFVAGTDPTSLNDKFTASITLVDGLPIVSYTPELSPEQKALREYKTYGKRQLQDPVWTDISLLDAAERKVYNFFRVTVEMKP